MLSHGINKINKNIQKFSINVLTNQILSAIMDLQSKFEYLEGGILIEL